ALCRSDLYISRLKAEYQADGGLCGIQDWRLPSIYELDSLVSYELPQTSQYEPARLLLDANFFKAGANQKMKVTHHKGAGYCSGTRKLISLKEFFSPYDPLQNSPENYPVVCRDLVFNIEKPIGVQTEHSAIEGLKGHYLMLVTDTPREQ
ncbi:MAG: DUF1566 domain-containing protein, partial [Oleispira sp.]|nr:DUF1566 domain-containing protein [Oleispira sp.]